MTTFLSRAFLLGVASLALCAACSSPAEEELDTLAPILERERTKALVAARVGPSGGTLEINKGDLSGTTFIVPKGALAGEAVISLYAATEVDESEGYRPAGPYVKIKSTVEELRTDAQLRMPFEDDLSGDPVVLLSRDAGGVIRPLPGVVVNETSLKGPVRTFGEFGAAFDEGPVKQVDPTPSRCEYMPNGISMKAAIATSEIAALNVYDDAQLFWAFSNHANPCGVAPIWHVAWFSDTWNKYAYLEVYSSGAYFVELANDTLPCTPQGYTLYADSLAIADDVMTSYASPPTGLGFHLRNCNVGVLPPQLRVYVWGTSDWFEYSASGTYLGRN